MKNLILHIAASDLGLHCLSITFLRVSRLQWVKCSSLWTSLLFMSFKTNKLIPNKMITECRAKAEIRHELCFKLNQPDKDNSAMFA